jgi:hypothetical protein
LGTSTAGSWSIYFDGSDVGLATNGNEDVNALYVRETAGNPTLYFSTLGNFAVTGASGANEDAVAFTPTGLGQNTAGAFGPGLAFDGSLYGLGPFNVDGIHLVPPASPLAGGAQSSPLQASVQTQSSADAVVLPAPVAQAAQPASAATLRTTSSPALLNTVLSELSASRKSTAASTCDCGQTDINAVTSADKDLVSADNLTVWDHVAGSLDDILRAAMLS